MFMFMFKFPYQFTLMVTFAIISQKEGGGAGAKAYEGPFVPKLVIYECSLCVCKCEETFINVDLIKLM